MNGKHSLTGWPSQARRGPKAWRRIRTPCTVGGVPIELLVVPDCPNADAARAAVRAAAAQAGIAELPATVTVIATDEEARRRGFCGSPTFLIDGIDPFAVPDAPTGLTCRLYPTARGLSGVPEVTALRDALIKARASRSST
jgi:hypothetical protein